MGTEKMNTDQIVAKAWKRMVATGHIQDTPSVEADFTLIIKAAIEKVERAAYKEGYSAGLADANRFRAAHASEEGNQ